MLRIKTPVVLFLISGISILTWTCSGHSKVVPPDAVKASFDSRFSDAGSVNWENGESDFQAVFSDQGHVVTAFFTKEGTWIKTETEMISSELPTVVVKTIVGAFPGNSVTKAARVDSADNQTYYRLNIRRKDKNAVVRLSTGGVILMVP